MGLFIQLRTKLIPALVILNIVVKVLCIMVMLDGICLYSK